MHKADRRIEETWFRLKIKQLSSDDITSTNKYVWIDTSFFSSWTEEANTLICFDLPESMSSSVQVALKGQSRPKGNDFIAAMSPYTLHTAVIDLVIPLFDKSIWTLSKNIRKIEQVTSWARLGTIGHLLTAANTVSQQHERHRLSSPTRSCAPRSSCYGDVDSSQQCP